MVNLNQYFKLSALAKSYGARLLVVTKYQSREDILQLYESGHRLFGENRVDALLERKATLPADIEWHMIGSLQKNKIKQLVEWISCIQSIDSLGLADKVHEHANRINRNTTVLFEVKIAAEPSKHGFEESELQKLLDNGHFDLYPSMRLSGLMGMASFTNDHKQISTEFAGLRKLYDALAEQYSCCKDFDTLSMGMSGDYELALEQGSTMLRIGSILFQA
ncbi:MAG: YggS family pyridoxal phosphate-dependent enzyme [Saprospiraceae bacterium]|nr:YggS family pyridoxal phosphate-dependent enzyme [Saprospiraceae bacterium]